MCIYEGNQQTMMNNNFCDSVYVFSPELSVSLYVCVGNLHSFHSQGWKDWLCLYGVSDCAKVPCPLWTVTGQWNVIKSLEAENGVNGQEQEKEDGTLHVASC